MPRPEPICGEMAKQRSRFPRKGWDRLAQEIPRSSAHAEPVPRAGLLELKQHRGPADTPLKNADGFSSSWLYCVNESQLRGVQDVPQEDDGEDWPVSAMACSRRVHLASEHIAQKQTGRELASEKQLEYAAG